MQDIAIEHNRISLNCCQNQRSILKSIEQYGDLVLFHCKSNHNKNCGCFTESFLQQALFYNAGHDEEKICDSVIVLAKYHSKNNHSHCTFMKKKLFVVVKGKKAIMRTPKQYCSRNSLTCPYHQLMYKIDFTQKSALKSNSLIHPTLGKLRTNATESCFNTLLTRFRNKSNHLKCMHYEVCTNLGLIHSNMTRLINSDEKYH